MARGLEAVERAARGTENLLPPQPVATGANAAPKPKSLQPPSAAIPILEKAISQIDSEDGWVLMTARL